MQTHVNGGAPFLHSAQIREGILALGPSVFFFADDNGENAPLYIGMIALFNGPVSAETVASPGAARREGLYAPPAPRLFTTAGGQLTLTWTPVPGFLLQRSANLTNWTNLDATCGAGSWSEPLAPGKAFFRPGPR